MPHDARVKLHTFVPPPGVLVPEHSQPHDGTMLVQQAPGPPLQVVAMSGASFWAAVVIPVVFVIVEPVFCAPNWAAASAAFTTSML